MELLQARPVQCYKCWKYGHVSSKCRSDVDRSDACFRCGLSGHVARNCNAAVPMCFPCREAGKPASHRMGSKGCDSVVIAQPLSRGRMYGPVKEVVVDATASATQ